MEQPRYQILLASIFLFGLLLRTYLALNSVYIWDEERDWIPAALSISYAPETLNLPIRTWVHGALSAYLIDLGSIVFGQSHFGFRASNIIAGSATILVVAALGRRFLGPACGLFAALFIAVNEFHIMVSAVAIQMSHYLFFEALAIYFFVRALQDEKPWLLSPAAVFAGLGFLSYEIGALLAPAVLVPLFSSRYRHLWKSKHLYLAALLGIIVILPDIIWNLAHGANAGYGNLLGRIGSIGFSPKYMVFFGRDAVDLFYGSILGRPPPNEAGEYMGMNTVFGTTLLVCVAFWVVRLVRRNAEKIPEFTGFYIFLFFEVVLFFTLIRPPAENHISLWIWICVTLIPLSVLAGGAIQTSQRFAWLLVFGLSVGSVWSGYNLVFKNNFMPQYKAIATPEFIKLPDGEFANVSVHFDHCDICPSDREFQFRDVSVRNPGQPEATSILGNPDVLTPQVGAEGTEFRLPVVRDLAPPSFIARKYQLSYELPRSNGTGKLVTAETRVVNDVERSRPPIFWIDDQLSDSD